MPARRPDGAERRGRIVEAACALLVRGGIQGWSTEKVAQEADCAKGLVHYHFRGRHALLAAVAARLARERCAGFQRALGGSPAAALDRMWVEAVRQVSSGEFGARQALLASGDAGVREACRAPEEALPALAAAIGDAIALDDFPAARAETTLAVCEGLQALLMTGGDPRAARDAFDRWWIAQLPG